MNKRFLAILGVIVLLAAAVPASMAGARVAINQGPIAVDIDARLKGREAPQQPFLGTDVLPATATTTESVCDTGTDEFLIISIASFDPAHPGEQDVVFWKESFGGFATLWVAWDFLTTDFGRTDVITCEQLAYLQGAMDEIVETNVYYFGEYVQRPAGNANIDVMIYNIVDEGFYDDAYPYFIAGFFWSTINQTFDRNMVFIDSLDWANRLGPDVARPYDYEATVAHELQHLIHSDHDADEDSWIDEGMADLAEYLNGFGQPDSHVVYYLAYHRTPLTVWGGGLESYGASYLFQLYLLENFGTKDGSYETGWANTWTRKEIDEQANSIEGVEIVTEAEFNDLFDAWMVANYLDKPAEDGAGGFPIGYDTINLAPYNSPRYGAWSIKRAITDIYTAGHHGNLPVSRYWGGYISGTVEYPAGDITPYTPVYGLYKGMQPELGFFLRGNASSGVAPKAGTHEAASGGGHLLTNRTLALLNPVNTIGGASLDFWTWFDIEVDWDYGFVEVSEDGGGLWYPIPGSITELRGDPNNSTAWANSLIGGQSSTDTAITGNSGGWVAASFPLPEDDNLMIRFNYYTDEATNGQGWYIDEVSVGALNDGFEAGDANWSLGGWTITTGLFDNDWIAGYVNPIYNRRKLVTTEWDYVDGTVAGLYEYITDVINTSKLNSNAATVFFANRPGDSPFAAGYLLLVEKGTAAP